MQLNVLKVKPPNKLDILKLYVLVKGWVKLGFKSNFKMRLSSWARYII